MRPAYEAMLAFYAEVFIAQEKAKGDIDLEPIQLSSDRLENQHREKTPLLTPSAFRIDIKAGERLLIALCDLVVAHGTEIRPTAEAVRQELTQDRLKPSTLFADLLQGRDSAIHDTAAGIGADSQALAFLAHNALQPSLDLGAEQLAAYLDADAVWPKNGCPVCGSMPAMAVLGLEGRRELHCRYCRHAWRAPRLFCAFCENTQSGELHYFFAESEKDLRVDVCDRCQGFLKSVDSREASRPIFAPLEQIASLHLDMIATEKGFRADPDLNREN